MTLAATGTCDGCEREGPVQQLERVLLPSGHTAVCCPECRYHAEQLAERSSAACQGCGDDVTVADLAIAELPDDRTLRLCPDCLAEARSRDLLENDPGSGHAGHGGGASAGPSPSGSRGPSASRSRNGNGGSAGRSKAARANGGTATAGRAGRPGSSGTGRGSPGSTRSGSGRSGSNGSRSADARSRTSGSAGGGAGTGGRSGKPAPTRNTCDQCGDSFSVELYRVTTIDDRTEELCPTCKDECVERGIVTDVELRRAQAFEVLGITGSADQEEIRKAYLRRVKEVHPDREDGNRSEFMLVQEAYDRLRAE